MKIGLAVAGVGLMLLAGGCASSRTMYYWGSYENDIYDMYVEPGEAPPEVQVEHLEADIEKARSSGKALSPGFQAHLGYLYYQLGKLDLARRSFESEKAAFPESAQLMDRFIARLEAGHE